MRQFKLCTEDQHWWTLNDYGAVVDVVMQLESPTVLEFGPGTSTLALIEGGARHIDACEDDPEWMDVYRPRIGDRFPEIVTFHPYTLTDPLTVPALNGNRYDLALVDAPRNTLLREPVFVYALEHAARVMMPLEETGGRPGHLRPIVLALAQRYGKRVEMIDSGFAAGTFALLT